MTDARPINATEESSELVEGVGVLRQHFWYFFWLSLTVNMLMLVPTGYMLQVYDRVLNSRSHMTLMMLTLLVLFAYLLIEGLEWVRTDLLHKASLRLDEHLNLRIFNAVFEANLRRVIASGPQALSDLRVVRDTLSSQATVAVFDAPASLIFLILIYMISPIMGLLSLSGAILQVFLTWMTERLTQPLLTQANKASVAAQNYAQGNLRNAQVIEAMGMQKPIVGRWLVKQREFLALQALASDRAGSSSAASKFLQTTQGSLMLGLGCWLTIQGSFSHSGGMVIVASILGGRALAPLVKLTMGWKQVTEGRNAWQRINQLLLAIPKSKPQMPLPAPKGALQVEAVTAEAPGTRVTILRQVSFSIPAGTCLAIAGPSGAGKSTLARLLVGAWPASTGRVRLDGTDVFLWDKAELGPHIGYLPQDIELFDGTLAENIARFGQIDMAAVQVAAALVGLESTIAELPQAYDTRIGDEGGFLSGGQRQRVALARAFYNSPPFLVLDEPNANLDDEGDRILLQALQQLKARGATIVLVTHRTSLLPVVDRLLLLRDGQVRMFGARDAVLVELQNQNSGVQTISAPVPTAA